MFDFLTLNRCYLKRFIALDPCKSYLFIIENSKTSLSYILITFCVSF